MAPKRTNPTSARQPETARRVPLHGLGVGLATLLSVATVHTARAQEHVVQVHVAELGYGSALNDVFTIHSATHVSIGYRTIFYPQIPGYTTSFAREQAENMLTLSLTSYVHLIEITDYDASHDVLSFTRAPGYEAGCQSPYIPAAIPAEVVNHLCSSFSGQ